MGTETKARCPQPEKRQDYRESPFGNTFRKQSSHKIALSPRLTITPTILVPSLRQPGWSQTHISRTSSLPFASKNPVLIVTCGTQTSED